MRTCLVDSDILCFTESKLDETIENDEISLPGFHEPIRLDRNRHGGGVAVFVKSYLMYDVIDVPNELCNCECVWLKVSYTNKKFILGCVYRPPGVPVEWWSHFQNMLTYVLDKFHDSDIVVVGDFNEDLLDNRVHHLSDMIAQNGFMQFVDKPTRITPTSATLLDPLIVNNPNLISFCDVLDPLLSDHCYIKATLHWTVRYDKAYQKKVWLYDAGNYNELNVYLQTMNWRDTIENEHDLDIMCEKFTEIINKATSIFVPNKTVTVRPRDKPWMNSAIRSLMRIRLKAYRKARDSGFNARLWEKYKNIRNDLIEKIRKSKKDYLNKKAEKLQSTSHNEKNWWKVVGELTKFKNKAKCVNAIRSNENPDLLINDPTLIAEELNNYFVKTSTINDTDLEVPPVTLRTENRLSEVNIDEHEIVKILKMLDINKATGPDGISNRVLRECATVLCYPLCLMFNKLVGNGHFPSCWKVAHVTAIPKTGTAKLAKDFRPISITSNVGKVLERVIYNKLIYFLDDNNLIYKYQAGFLAHHSTETQLVEMYHNICKELDKRNGVQMVFCDYSKAFDRVWHNGLIEKLKAHGISGTLLMWFRCYLSGRKQCVIINSHKSKFKTPTAGVPQGSVLGPLLFLIFINDLQDVITSYLRQFADDVSTFSAYRQFTEVIQSLVPDLNSILRWSNKWLMGLNPTKTEGLNISLVNTERQQITIGNEIIMEVDFHKHLGLVFNNKATWSNQIKYMYDKALKRIGVLRSLKYNFDRKTLETLYFSYVRPIMEYASSVWDNCTMQESELLEKVQVDAARVVTGLPKFCSLQELYIETGWTSLNIRRKVRKLVLMYKIVNNLAPAYLTDILPVTVAQSQAHNLRNNSDIRNVRTRTSLYENSFFPSTIKLWNELSNEIRNLPNLEQFIYRLKREFYVPKPPVWYSYGDRKYNIVLCRLRNRCSILKADLFRCSLVDSPACQCGFPNETCQHFFFSCSKYNDHRLVLFSSIEEIGILNASLNLLLCGSQAFSLVQNKKIVDFVLQFIKQTKRFNVDTST